MGGLFLLSLFGVGVYLAYRRWGRENRPPVAPVKDELAKEADFPDIIVPGRIPDSWAGLVAEIQKMMKEGEDPFQ
jgi:hypothetical protein